MKGILILLSFLLITSAFGQRYNFKKYNVEDGLAQSQINDISQDRLGYLWIATETGLSRFNGLDFRNYSMVDGLPDNKIEKIFFDADSVLWVGTPNGLAKFENNKFLSYPFLEPRRVNDIALFQGEMYVATNDGLLLFQNGKYELIDPYREDQLYIRSLVNYKNEYLICGTKTGIFHYASTFDKIFKETSDFNISDIKLIGEELILATYGDGLLSYNIQDGSLSEFDIIFNRIRSIYADEEVILGSSINGAVEITEDETYHYNEENGLPDQSLVCVFKDREGNYWMGTDGHGILKFLGKSITSYSTNDGLSSSIVMSISQDKDSSYIFGTYREGITKLQNGGELTYVNSENGLSNNSVWATALDNYGRCWIGTSDGVNCLEDGKVVLAEISKQIDTKIRSIAFMGEKYFFGGTAGLYVMSDGHVLYLEHTSEMNINDLCVVGSKIYAGSRNGLYVLDESDNFSTAEMIQTPELNIFSISNDQRGNLWIGTANGLFVLLEDNLVVPFELDVNDFKSRTILGIIESKDGDIWISSMNGVYVVQSLSETDYSYRINHYATPEGLINLESNLNALYEDYQGAIWVGTSNGLAKIDPSLNDKLFDFKRPELHFTGIRLFMEGFDYDRFEVTYANNGGIPTSISLPYDQNHLTFDFIGINLKNPESVQYEYRLSGANESWSPLSEATYATYSDISPGEYDFEVRATNKSLNWSPIQRIHVTIRPPFWKTWWFIITMFMLTFFIVLVIFQVRIRAIKQKQENEKLSYKNRLLFLEQQSLNASMNRHFIFNSLNSIQYFINSSDKLSANKYLSSFAKLIRKNLDSSTNNNFIVTLQEEIDRIELYLTLEKMRFQEKFEYKLEVSSALDTEGTEIPSMILQPFVENSIIHGVLPLDRKGLISVKIYEEYDEVVFEVIDDGIGIDNTLKNKKESIAGDHESKGMEITSRRIELLRKLTGENLLIIGPFQINNEEGECLGTKVIIKMGLPQEE